MNNLSKKDRINMVFSSLKENGEISSQADLAKAIGASEATISKALKGEEKALTDNLLKRISRRFIQYSLDWMANGIGTMLNNCGCSSADDESIYHPSSDGTCTDFGTDSQRTHSGGTTEDVAFYKEQAEFYKQQASFYKEQAEFYKSKSGDMA